MAALLLGIAVPRISPAQSPGKTMAPDGVSRPGILFRATQGPRTVWLFGTVHFGAKSYYPLAQPVMGAIASSRALALEIDIRDAANSERADREVGLVPDGARNAIVDSADKASPLAAALQAYGISREKAGRMRSWHLTRTLSSLCVAHAGLDPILSNEAYLVHVARTSGKTIHGLESIGDLQAALSNRPEAEQDALLLEAARQIQDGECAREVGALARAWVRGDLEALQSAMKAPSSSSASEHESERRTTRNRQFAERIDHLARDESPLFVAVGAFHLTGSKSVLEWLGRMGYDVVRH